MVSPYLHDPTIIQAGNARTLPHIIMKVMGPRILWAPHYIGNLVWQLNYSPTILDGQAPNRPDYRKIPPPLLISWAKEQNEVIMEEPLKASSRFPLIKE